MTHSTKQPAGMYVLAFTEVFERLSYYTLTFLLVLYASDTLANGGLGWTKEKALITAGYYTLGSYALPLIGGFLADKYFGPFYASVLGAIIIIAGHTLMLFSSNDHILFFYLALVFVASGTSFFKPSMPTMLGRLYGANDSRRDAGFKIYYTGINIGSMAAGFSSGLFLKNFGYHIALFSAGVGMVLGIGVFLAFKKYLVTDRFIHSINGESQQNSPIKSNETKKLDNAMPHFQKAFSYLMLSFVFCFLWAVVYNIVISGTLTLYIENYTKKTVFGYDLPTTFFMSLEAIGIIISAPTINYIVKKLEEKHKQFHFFSQMNLALSLCFLCIAYLTYLTYVVTHSAHTQKPFHYMPISLVILCFSVSEVLISPVMMSAISMLSPIKYKVLFQSFYLTILGITGVIASRIGVISFKYPFETFLVVSVICFVGVIAFLILRPRMVKTALLAGRELDNLHT